MALDRAKASLYQDGVVLMEDPGFGQKVDEFDRKQFPFQTVEGLDFCRNALEDERILRLIESVFERSSLGLVKVYGPRPDTVFSFLNNSSNETIQTEGKDGVKVLLVQLWSTNSVAVFYKRSHLQLLRATNAKIGLLEVPKARLETQDVEKCEIAMKEGGFAIIDGRLAFTIIRGVVITLGFAVNDELKYWRKMKLPDEPALIGKVESMMSDKIGINVEYIKQDNMKNTT